MYAHGDLNVNVVGPLIGLNKKFSTLKEVAKVSNSSLTGNIC